MEWMLHASRLLTGSPAVVMSCMMLLSMVLITATCLLWRRLRSHAAGRVALGAMIAVDTLCTITLLGLPVGVADLRVELIHHYGIDGDGVIVRNSPTASLYNNRPVHAYDVVIRTGDGKVHETRFRSDAFNVWPPTNRVSYPDVGDHFTARYLPHHPDDFIILADDDTPWARSLRCRELGADLAEAYVTLAVASDVPHYQKAYKDAMAVMINAGCPVDDPQAMPPALNRSKTGSGSLIDLNK